MDPISLIVGLAISFVASLAISAKNPSVEAVANRSADKLYRVEFDGRFVGTAFAMKINGQPQLVTAGHICDVLTVPQLSHMKKEVVAEDGTRIEINERVLSGKHDMCLMNKLPKGTPSFKLSKSSTKFELAWAVGYPAGRGLSATAGMTVGTTRTKMPMQRDPAECVGEAFSLQIIVGKDKPELICVFEANSTDTTVAVAPGNSGSPLLNYRGEVIGVVSYLDSSTPGYASVVPVEVIQAETK